MSSKSGSSKKPNVVTFYEVHDPQYGLLSPLSPTPVVVRHVQYPSLHHYFLCERFKDSPAEQWIMEATTVWSLDRLVKTAEAEGYQRSNWNKVKVDVMLLGTYLKFKQNDAPRTVLLNTQSAMLLYHTSTDDFWGDGGDGKGKNVLGVVTMAARNRLQVDQQRQQQQQTQSSKRGEMEARSAKTRTARAS
ncbi:NADAR domain containing protein [Lotmaria passim]